jgi:serine phosphatase RsbU (regulator of sigma subunit)
VQAALLPEGRPEVAAYEFWDAYEPAHQVGGDYFGYLPVGRPGDRPGAPACRWAVALGDVAGKGMSAALLMAKLSAEVRLLLLTEPEPARAVGRLNRHLCDTGVQDKFITFLLVLLDAEDHRLTIVNAGHMGPLIRRADGRIEVIGQEGNGLALAIDRDRTYEAVVATLEPGDLVVLYTDGVSDATDPRGKHFGVERLKRTLRDAPGSAAAAGASILQAVSRHAAGHTPHDDLTLLCFGRAP